MKPSPTLGLTSILCLCLTCLPSSWKHGGCCGVMRAMKEQLISLICRGQ